MDYHLTAANRTEGAGARVIALNNGTLHVGDSTTVPALEGQSHRVMACVGEADATLELRGACCLSILVQARGGMFSMMNTAMSPAAVCQHPCP